MAPRLGIVYKSPVPAVRTLVSLFVSAVLASACATRAPAPSAAKGPSAIAGMDGADAGAGDSEDGGALAENSADAEAESAEPSGPCPEEMVLVTSPADPSRHFCVDKYEASLVELASDGTEHAFPHYVPVDGHDVRAVSRPDVFPQGYISEVQAQDACAASGKRLCNLDEWKTACMGPSRTTFPYGDARRPGACHDTGKSAVIAVFGAKAVAASMPYSGAPPAQAPTASLGGKRAVSTRGRAAQTTHARVASTRPGAKKPGAKLTSKKQTKGRTGKKSTRPASVDPGVWAKLNDPALGQVDGALAKPGDHPECMNDFGVFDMVGNLHEWVATDPAAMHGAFAGGYYLDTTINGDGCNYKTSAHAHDYHDYSTGFRCCAPAQE